MKQKIPLTVLILIIISAYLYFSYSRIHNYIRDKQLPLPSNISAFTLENPQGQGIIKYVALGDSLSAGVGSTNYKETLVYQEAVKLVKEAQKVDVINLSQPGATSIDILQQQLPQAIIQQPDIVTILVGVNDIHNFTKKDEFGNNFKTVLDQLQTNTQANIVVFNIPYLGSPSLYLPPYNFYYDYKTQQFNKTIELFKDNPRVKLIDLYKATRQKFSQDDSMYSVDLFHPSNKGYMLWGQVINAN